VADICEVCLLVHRDVSAALLCGMSCVAGRGTRPHLPALSLDNYYEMRLYSLLFYVH